MAMSVEDPPPSTSTRALRRTSRVNYTEERVNSAFTSSQPPQSTSKPNGVSVSFHYKPKSVSSSPPVQPINNNSSSESTAAPISTAPKLELESLIPSSWKTMPEDAFSAMPNLISAYVDPNDSSLHLQDGTIYSPEGKFFHLKIFF